MKTTSKKMNFWDGETCEYCSGAIREKRVTVYRQLKEDHVLIENVPAGVCTECGTRYYAANVLKMIEDRVHGHGQVQREIVMQVYAL
jgi:YgiT-type zinc finger domain-containing protein